MSRKKRRTKKANITKSSYWATLIKYLAAPGVVLALVSCIYKYFAANVSLEFVGSDERRYDFLIKNGTPVDWRIETLRIKIPTDQQFIYTITEDVYVRRDETGVHLPDGNRGYVPAADYKELDNQIVHSNSELKFRIPPLSNLKWMLPAASIADIEYKMVPSNSALGKLEELMALFKLRNNERKVRYLIIDNYWTVTFSDSVSEAVRIYCRDNGTLIQPTVCTN